MTSWSLHDILVAWRDGRIDYRRALDLAQIDTLGELYTAAELSGVQPRLEPSEHEQQQGQFLADLLRERDRSKAA